MDTRPVRDYFSALQARIVAALEQLEGTPFAADSWERAEGGGGTTRVIEEGKLFERGGVNFSHVSGAKLPPSASASRPQLAGQRFEALGVSLVLHPRNPYCPTVHMNVRFFAAGDAWWFGGGMDLTPYYGFEDDAKHFHATCKRALEPFGAELHQKFKKGCDEYFFLKHRNEPRGIGGIFFDDLTTPDFAGGKETHVQVHSRAVRVARMQHQRHAHGFVVPPGDLRVRSGCAARQFLARDVGEADAAALEQLAFLDDAGGAAAALGALPGVGGE